jgi:hypothetical protein
MSQYWKTGLEFSFTYIVSHTLLMAVPSCINTRVAKVNVS